MFGVTCPQRGLSTTVFPYFPCQTLQNLFSTPRLGEPGVRTPLFTPETDKLRLDSPFPFLGSGKGLGGGGETCTGERTTEDRERGAQSGVCP